MRVRFLLDKKTRRWITVTVRRKRAVPSVWITPRGENCQNFRTSFLGAKTGDKNHLTGGGGGGGIIIVVKFFTTILKRMGISPHYDFRIGRTYNEKAVDKPPCNTCLGNTVPVRAYGCL
jgi:hypothetical protein